MHIDKFRKHLDASRTVADDFKNETYLDYAELSLKNLINRGIQKSDGIISDPFDVLGVTYRGKKLELFYYHAEARFCGALGQIIKAGRMTEYADRLYLSYNHLMNILAYDFEPAFYAEFWVKELVFAYEGLCAVNYPGVSRDIWEKVTWRKYGFHYFNNYYNGVAYALTSEACMIEAGLGGDTGFFDTWAPVLFDKFDDELGMFRDPGVPMSYDLITRQQLLFAIQMGADGEHKEKALNLCDRGAVSSLYMQSVTGQMPFGGRTNQFLCVEGFLATYFEMMVKRRMSQNKIKEAGIYKRASHNAVISIEPWLKMQPLRHIRQGFAPEMGHGIDSGGVYTVYGLLASSMLGTAYLQSRDNTDIQCYETPAERGGYVFSAEKYFHKVFASCGDYHLEIDTCADLEKDATGLGRLHKKGIMPETAISGSFSPDPTYSYAMHEIEPAACAVGPAWLGLYDEVMSLAGCRTECIETVVNVMYEGQDEVVFRIEYHLEGRAIEETYQLSADGLLYSVKGEMPGLHIAIPVIKTDGQEISTLEKTSEGIVVKYRGAEYKILCDHPEITEESCVNRNGIYRIARIMDHMVKLQLSK